VKKIALLLAVVFALTALFGPGLSEVTASPGLTVNSNADTDKAADTYDVIVIGGEPEGIAAAVSAARNGQRTLLVEHGDALGGLMTLGGLNFLDMNYGPEKELLTQGIFAEFFEEMGNAFDLEEAKEYFLQLVRKEENLDLLLKTSFVEPVMSGQTIIGVRLKENGQDAERSKIYYGARIIDATVDADVAAAAGVSYTEGAEDYGRKGELMGVTLVFRVKKVNWPFVFIYNNLMRLLSKIKSDWGDPYAGAGWKVAWGYGQQALEYQPHNPNVRFRGPNLARQKDGTVLVNALLLFGVDGTDPVSRAESIRRGKEELPYIIEFMRESFPGFRRVELVDTAERLYVRETRHIMGEYRLTITDVLENRDHWDRIAHGSYPVDIQPTAPDNLGNVIGKPAIYSIPFRCLVPLGVDNLLVAGRSASYDSLPHGSARVIPVGMATGEAAGVAAAYSIENGLGFREISRNKEAVAAIQARLKEQGAYLTAYTPPRPAVIDHWAYPAMAAMRELGLAAGGYSNNYQLDTGIQYWDANYVFGQTLERTAILQAGAEKLNPGTGEAEESGTVTSGAGNETPGSAIPTPEAPAFTEGVSVGALLRTAARLINAPADTPEAARSYLAEKGYLSTVEAQHLTDLAAQPTFGELYAVAAAFQKGLQDATRAVK
jgi:hypothetical protein